MTDTCLTSQSFFRPGTIAMVSMPGTTGPDYAGCSKGSSSKAAASEGPRRYVPHFVWAVRPLDGSWRTEKPLQCYPHPRGSLGYVEGLNDARTPLADFFSILLSATGNSVSAGQSTAAHRIVVQKRRLQRSNIGSARRRRWSSHGEDRITCTVCLRCLINIGAIVSTQQD